MPDSDVEIISGAWAAWAERDMDGAAEVLHPEVEWDLTRFDEAPPGTVARGVDEVMELIALWLSTWRSYDVRVESYEPGSGGNVLLTVRRRARELATGADADRVAAQVWTVDGGKVIRIRSFSDPDEARREAGLG